MDETLDNEQWIEPVAQGVGAAVGSVVWVPRGADWFIALLKTIEDRYAMLPQPGHRCVCNTSLFCMRSVRNETRFPLRRTQYMCNW